MASFAAEFRRAKVAGCSANMPGLGLLGAWLAINHPTGGDAVRRAVSAAMRRDGWAHVTFCLSAAGLAIALAPRFVDLALLPAATHGARAVLVVRAEPESTEVMQ